MTDELDPVLFDDDIEAGYLQTRREELSPSARVSAFQARKERERRRIASVREQADILKDDRRNFAGDIAVGVGRGVVNAVDETFIAIKDLARWVLPVDKIAAGTASAFRGEGFTAGLEASDQANAAFSADLRRNADELLPETDTTAGGVAQGISQFITGFVPIARAAQVGKAATSAANFGRATVAGGIADATVFDPHEQRLSDLVQRYPVLQNPVSEYLASDPGDTEAEGRFKNALEGAVIGTAIDGLLRGLRVLRASRRMKAEAEIDAKVEAEPVPIPEAKPADTPADTLADDIADNTAGRPAGDITDNTAGEAADDIAANAADTASATVGASAGVREVPPIRVRPENIAEFQRRVSEGNLSEAQKLIDFNADTIDFDSIDNGDDLRRLLNTASESFSGLIDEAKGGVQRVEQTKRLAKLVGGTEKQVASLFADVRGDNGITARVLAAEQTMVASAQKLKTLARAVVEDGDNASRVALARHIEVHAAIQAQVKGAKAEIARSLHAMRIMKQASEIDFDEFESLTRQLSDDPASTELAKKLAKTTDLVELNTLTRKTRWQRFRDAALELWINGLLSGPTTHAVNALSNTVKAVEASIERTVAAGIGSVRRGVFRQDAEVIEFREAASVAIGTLRGLADAVQIPAKLRRGDDALPFLDTRSKLEVDTQRAIQFDTSGTEGIRRVTAQAGNLLGAAVRIPGAALEASDNVFKTIAYRQQLQAVAYRKAASEANQAGLRGTQRAETIAARANELLSKPTEEIHLAAVDFAQYQTFTRELGSKGKAFQAFLAKVPMLRLVFPFVRTPTNIVKQVAERTPLPIFKALQGEYREMLLRGGPEADLVLARIGIGTGLMTAVWQMAEAGFITGGGAPGRNTESLDGIKPYSVKVGDRWLVYNRLEPLGMLMGSIADLHEMAKRSFDPDGDNVELMDASRLVLFGTLKNVTSKTYLRGASELAQFASDPDRYGDRWLQNFGGTLVPFSSALRTAARANDEYAREAFTYLDALKEGLPGFSKTLPLQRDILGRPIKPGTQWVSPIRVSEESDDPLDRELARLAFNFSMPSRQISGVPLTAEQYSELLRIRGQEPIAGKSLDATLREFIRTQEYQALPDDPDATIQGTKQDAIKRIISRYGSAAREKLLEQHPGLNQRVEAEKLRRRPQAQPQNLFQPQASGNTEVDGFTSAARDPVEFFESALQQAQS